MSARVRRRRRAAAGVVAAGSIAAVLVGGIALAGVAHAALVDVPATGEPGRLVLSSDPYPAQFLDLSPGEPARWMVAARIENASAATLALELRAGGRVVDHPRGLRMTVDVCPSAWTALDAVPACAAGGRRVSDETPAARYATEAPSFALDRLDSAAPQYLLVTLAVEDSAAARADASLRGLAGEVAVGLHASAFDDPPAPDAGVLPATGVPLPAAGALLLAVGLVGLGVALRMSRTAAAP